MASFVGQNNLFTSRHERTCTNIQRVQRLGWLQPGTLIEPHRNAGRAEKDTLIESSRERLTVRLYCRWQCPRLKVSVDDCTRKREWRSRSDPSQLKSPGLRASILKFSSGLPCISLGWSTLVYI